MLAFTQGRNTRVFTMFTSGGCGCTGSGGAPLNFVTHEMVMSQLQNACDKVDFVRWEGTLADAYNEVEGNKNNYDGVLIIGRVSGDYRLAVTGLPTIFIWYSLQCHTWRFEAADQGLKYFTGDQCYRNRQIILRLVFYTADRIFITL